MDHPRRFCFQTRPSISSQFSGPCRRPYIPGIPTLCPPSSPTPETVHSLIERYRFNSHYWHAQVFAGKYCNIDGLVTPANLIRRDELRVPLGVDKDAFIRVSDVWISEYPGREPMAIMPKGRQFITAEALGLAFLTDPNSGAIYVHVEPDNTITAYEDLAARVATGQPLPPVVECLRLAATAVTSTSTMPDAPLIPQDGNQHVARSVNPHTSILLSLNRERVPDFLSTANPAAAVHPESIPRTSLVDLFADHFFPQLPTGHPLYNHDINDPDLIDLLGKSDSGAYTYKSALPPSDDKAPTEKPSPSVENDNTTTRNGESEDTGGQYWF